LLDGFAVALSRQNLGWALLGCTLGSAVGVLPGIGPALTVALLLPVIAKLEPTGALIMLAGVYYGAKFAVPPPRFCSTRRASLRPSSRRSRAISWRSAAVAGRRLRRRRSVRF
jgi:hypothetical protein